MQPVYIAQESVEAVATHPPLCSDRGDGGIIKISGNADVAAKCKTRLGAGIGSGGTGTSAMFYSTNPGNSGTCNVLGYSYVVAEVMGNADDFGIGEHFGDWFNYMMALSPKLM